MTDPITRLTAARFDGPQALYTEAVALLSERPAMPDDLAGLVKRLREPWFTNGCAQYQREAADAIEALAAENARLLSEPQCAAVKPLAWITLEASDWLKVYDGPACAKITAIHRVPPKSGMGVPVYSEPLTIRPEAEVRAEAWAAALAAAEEALRLSAVSHRVIAGMDLIGASAVAYNAARDAEAAIAKIAAMKGGEA